MASGRNIVDLRIGWKVKLWCRRRHQRTRGHRSLIVEGTYLGMVGQTVRILETATGRHRWIPAADVVRCQRVLGSIDDRRRARAQDGAA